MRTGLQGPTGRRPSYRSQGIPFEARAIALVDPRGGLWTVDGAEYRITRLDEEGDTTLVLLADVSPPPVTAQDRADFVTRMVEGDETLARTAEEIAAAMPATRPAISGLLMDDAGRLWVRRGGSEEDRPHYDLYSRDGDYQGAVRLDFTPSPYVPLRIRDGKIYALVRDDLDVPYVVRAAVVADEA